MSLISPIVADEADLNTDIQQMDTSSPTNWGTITLSANISLNTDLLNLNLGSGGSVTIIGQGFTINGGGSFRGFMVNSGNVTLSNMTIADAVAQGGAGGNGGANGGGGAGLGGGLFVTGTNTIFGLTTGATVTLNGVNFTGDAAIGGNSGQYSTGLYGAGGGGGMGGAGGSSGQKYHNPSNGQTEPPGSGGGGGLGKYAYGAQGKGPSAINTTTGIGDAYGLSSGGDGGAHGGGGASGAGTSFSSPTGASGGGVNGGAGATNLSGAGGFGGGGGGSIGGFGNSDGGAGGFGGGGGGASGVANRVGYGGAGGFGGGGGGGFLQSGRGSGGLGGFGGGNGNTDGVGGGGAALGADIFVQQGGQLVIQAGSLGTGGLTAGTGYQSGSAFGTGLFIEGNQIVTLAPGSGQTLTIAGVIADQTGSGGQGANAGAGELLIAGAGTVDLAAKNTYAGTTDVNSGVLLAGSADAIGGGALTIASGATVNLSGFTQTVGDLSGAGQIVLGGAQISAGTTNSTSFSGALSGAGELFKQGSGTLTLTGQDSAASNVISAGAVLLGTGGAISGSVSIASSALLEIDETSATTLNGILAGTGSLLQTGPAVTQLTGANSFSGAVTIAAGTLEVGAGGTSGSLGNAPSVSGSGVLAFDLSNATTFAVPMSGGLGLLQAGSGTTVLTQAETYTGVTTINAGTLQIGAGGTTGSINNTSNVTGAGVLAFDLGNTVTIAPSLGGALHVVQQGTGTTVLNAADSYSGGTTIEAGTLEIANGATAGTGTIHFSGAGELKIDGAIMPSNTIGNFAVGDTIDLAGLQVTGGTLGAGNVMSLFESGGGTVTLHFAATDNLAGDIFNLSSDGAGGTDLTLTSFTPTVTNEAGLNTDIQALIGTVFGSSQPAVTLAHGMTLTSGLTPIQLSGNTSLTINGGGFTLDGNNTYRGFFAYSGTVAINDLTLLLTRAQGGKGGNGGAPGGGGAGLGGGLFVASGANVTLTNVYFSHDLAVGGAGGYSASYGGNGGGGGGLFGDGALVGGPGVSPNSGGAAGGGAGGFGGGGGGKQGGFYGGNGGFGGGGGGGASSRVGTYGGGAGGFGGGGGGNGGAAGFGGGAGDIITGGRPGGGGLGAGGAIFVMQGGNLTFGASGGGVSEVHFGSVLGGAGNRSGSAFGPGIFIQGNQAITLDPLPSQSVILDDVIADQTGSAGAGGAGTLVVEGGGVVEILAANAFTGGTTILTGDVLLGDFVASIGSGEVSIAATGTLDLGGQYAQSRFIGPLSGAGTVELSATLFVDETSNTTFSGVLLGSNALIKQGTGTLTLSAGQSFTGGTTLQAGELEIGPAASAGTGTITFDSPAASLQIDGVTAPTNIIAQFISGDTIDLHGITYAASDILNYTTATGELDIINSGSTIASLFFGPGNTVVNDPFHINQETGGTGIVITNDTPCFLRGTLIRTPTGEVPVEKLSVGDPIVTLSGEVKPITWIGTGRKRVTPAKRTAATPIIVRKGAIADNVPHRDLHVTKGHSLFIDGVLIPVECLMNHRSIHWDDSAGTVEFYHIELAEHDVLVANGAAAESYRDDGNRWLFDNANAGWDQPSKPPYAPVLTGGPLVDAIWHRLLERSGPRPGLPLTGDPDLHLMVDGRRLDPIERRRDGAYVFRLDGNPRSTRIRSRSAVPQELGTARDPRMLGVSVRRLVVVQARHQRTINAASLLADGYHDYEPANDMRWTDGDAEIPATLLVSIRGPAMLIVELAAPTHYLDDGEVDEAA